MSLSDGISSYQSEQYQALTQAREFLASASGAERQDLTASLKSYLDFRRRVDAFLARHFNEICSAACYQSQRSACCSRDGIITYWADVVINALNSTSDRLDALRDRLVTRHSGPKCVYLGTAGCIWAVRPIVCAMFLCDTAEKAVFSADLQAKAQWDQLRAEKKIYAWPDQPVIFDDLEQWFMTRGCHSTLMYMHLSPGLMRLKRNWA